MPGRVDEVSRRRNAVSTGRDEVPSDPDALPGRADEVSSCPDQVSRGQDAVSC
jgi:hypothetical protein